MFYPPTLMAQSSGVMLTADMAASWPVLCVLALVVLAWGEARVHLSALREWKHEAKAQIEALQRESDTQSQQITHIVEMLAEVRGDLKQLLHRRDVG